MSHEEALQKILDLQDLLIESFNDFIILSKQNSVSSLTTQDINNFYHEFFGTTKNYIQSKRRNDYVAFAQALIKKAQEK